jgi:type II secretory ATPase GspE/PulE/Tfp pilus assembly ATPase PilB-like protein
MADVPQTAGQEETLEDLQKEVQFQKSLRELTNRIHSSALDDILLYIKEDISSLLEADRVTIYVMDRSKNEIYSKIADGEEVKEFRVPVSSTSLAGFVAENMKPLKIADAYDDAELKRFHPELGFDSSWDQKTGYRTKQVLAAPIVKEGRLNGVIQLVNKTDSEDFSDQDQEILSELSDTLSIAFVNQKRIMGRRSPWDLLLMNEKLSPEQLEDCQAHAEKEDLSVEQAMVEKIGIAKDEIGESLANHFRVPYRGFDGETIIPMGLIDKLDIDLLKFHLWVPIEEHDTKVFVIMENPRDIQLRDDIQARFKKEVEFCVAIREDIISFIDYFFGETTTEEEAIPAESIGDIFAQLEAEEGGGGTGEDEEEEDLKEDDSAIVKLVNQIIDQAYVQGASDIHIEPYPETDMMVRFRVDGVCKEYTKVPRRYSRAVLSRLKIMSGLDIAERRLPQDGKIKFRNYGPRDIELRVATLPTQGAQEDCVMRILAASKPIPLEKMGMRQPVYDGFIDIVKTPYGIILVVGPTGSGKTTTLHSALGEINKPTLKIWTAEDPVEITQIGLRQVQIHHKIGYTFERALRAFLRADPDVIMVGEMRDYETTSAGIEASLTGHLVFSTLHTNSAPETVTRLLDLGIDPFSFGDALLGVLAQRLIRTLCKKCKEQVEVTDELIDNLKAEFNFDAGWDREVPPKEEWEVYKNVGCGACNDTGYKGRMGIHELLLQSDEIKQLIYAKAKASEIEHLCQEQGMLTLKQDGIIKVLAGHSDLQEVRRVCIS